MARRGGRGSRSRRRRRRRKTGRHGGFGSPGTKKKKKKKKVNRARKKLRNKIRSKKLKNRVKSVKNAVSKKKNEKKKVKKKNRIKSIRNAISNTVSKVKKGFSIGGKAYGDAGRKAVRSVKKNTKNLGQVGRTLRKIRQPISGLSSMAINSVLGNKAIASRIAQAAVNNLGAQNARTRDMSKLSPQQQRKYQRLSEKTGRDYSIRNPTFKVNMNMKTIAKFAGLDKQGWYNKVPASIRNAQVNKQFYGNPMKKGWHSSQRTGRGQGISSVAESIGGQQQRRAAQAQAQQQNQAVERQNDYNVAQYEAAKSRMGPQQDWLSSLYKSHNISGGKLDQGARDYWSNEAKTKGRDSVMRSIIGTSKAQGTYGGRKKPRTLKTRGRK